MGTKFLITMLTIIYIFASPSKAAYFEMKLQRNSFYSPAKMSLTIKLTDEAIVRDDYKIDISIFVSESLTRRQRLEISREKPVVFELGFPQVSSRVKALCRAELLINGQLIEGQELPLTLWPPLEPYSGKISEKVLWVYDTSGYLRKFSDSLGIKIVDATFQAARQFATPDVVFIGINTDVNSIKTINKQLELQKTKPVIIYLKQKRLPKDINVEIPEEQKGPAEVVCDFNSPLLDGLNSFDIITLIRNSSYIKLKKQQEGTLINSVVSEEIKDPRNIYSYMFIIEQTEAVTIYCQLDSSDVENPQYQLLLTNLLRYAEKVVKSRE